MLEEAVRFAPDNAQYQLLLGRAKMNNRWWAEEGIAHLEEAARLEPSSAQIQGALAQAYLEQGAPEKALASARTALNVAAPEQKASYRELERRAEEASALEESGRRTLKKRLLGTA
jgi:cytochrome c-type biogenesis protein CcmH/NrfG